MKVGDAVKHKTRSLGEWWVVSINKDLGIVRVENKAGDHRAFQRAVLKVVK